MDALPFFKPVRFKINCFRAVTLVILIAAADGISLNAQETNPTYNQGGYGEHQLSGSSFKEHFENYYSSNGYLTDEQKAIYEDYWMCILSDRTDDIVKSLQWTASHGRWDDYFMALNYLVYVHDNHLKSPHLLGIIEDLIDHSVQQNILSSSVLLTNSVTYNIVKYLFERFRHIPERVEQVAYLEVDYSTPSPEDIEQLIAALGSSQDHLIYHSIMSNYLQTMPSLIYRQVNFKQAPRACLKQIISLLLNGTYKLSTNLRHACQYYIQLFNNQEMEHHTMLRNLEITTQLVQFLPAFNSTHRQVLTSFLTSGSMINDLVRLSGHPVVTESYLYNLMHNGLSLSGVTGPLREAFLFYLHYFENLDKISDLSHQLPQFVNSPGKEYYQQLVAVMNGPVTKEALITSGIAPLEIQSNHILQDTLSYYKTDSHFSEDIHTAASYYLGYYDILAVKQKYSLDTLLSIIPQPVDESDRHFYQNIQRLFESTTFFQIIKQSNLQVSSDHKRMLHDVLNVALHSAYSSVDCKSSILHYFRVMYNEGLSVDEARRVEYLIQELKSVNIDSRMYEVLTQFLQTDFVYLVAQYAHIDFTQQTFLVLEEMCNAITKLDFLDSNIKESAAYIASQVHQLYEQETQVIARIHQVFGSLQGAAISRVEKYEASLDVFLQCEEMHTILRHGHFDVNKDSRELLYDLLMVILEDANVSLEVREGAYHYCKYILEPLLGNVPCDMAELLKLLPLPSNHVTHSYFNILSNYLYLGVPRFITAQIDFTKTRVDLLLDILQALVYSDRIPVDVRGTAKYYWHFFNTRNDRVSMDVLANKLDRLTLLLPKPTSIHEAQYYNLMVSYLKGRLILKLLNTININLHKPDIKILRDIIVLTLNTKLVYMDFKIVARYYLNKIDSGVICDIGNEEADMQASTTVTAQTTMNTQHALTANYATAATVANNQYQTQTPQSTQAAQSTTSHPDLSVYTGQEAATTATTAATAATATTANIASASSAATTGTISATTQQSTMATAATTSASHKTETTGTLMTAASSTTTSTTILTAHQTTVLQKIETELNSMTVGQENAADQQVLQTYVKTPTAYKLLETSGVDLEAAGSKLLADFVQIAAHTNDIPVDLRLASERYELAIPSLKQVAIMTPYTHLISLDNIFHTIPVPIKGQASENFILCYNAIDRYLHTEVPSKITHGTHFDLKIAPIELLRDFLMIAQEIHLSQQDIQTIDALLQQSREPAEGADTPLLDHLYRLHKVFQLLVLPDQPDCVDYYYTLDSFLRSSTIYEIIKTNIDFNIELTDLLKSILNLIINTNPTVISKNIIQAAVYYDNLMFTHVKEEELDIVFHLVPIPEGEQEVQAFNTVNEYIHSPNAEVISQNVNFDTQRTPSAILTNILDLASHSVKVKPNVREASSILLNKLRTSSVTSTTSTGTIHTQKMVYLHSSVHSLSSIVSTSAVVTTTSQYIGLLNILPQGFTATEDYKVLYEYFGQLSQTTMETMFTQEELSMISGNEEGLLRLILLKLVHDTTIPVQVRVACAHLIKQRYFDFGVFVSYIPAAKLPEEQTYSALLTQFFTGDEIYRYSDLTTTYNTDLNSFKLILTSLSRNEQVSAEIRSACGYYLSHAPFVNFGILVDLLPAGTSHNVQKLRSTMVHFLTTPELINSCIQNINLTNYGTANDQFLNELLLLTEKCNSLDENIRVAAKYFLTVIKPVAVSVQKVLTKTLDLSEIFNDVFDFSSFTKIQFDAFHTFWSYVSERTQEILVSPGFDFWSENNKRGAFTIKFLHALDLKAEVPADIHESIAILTPLVHMDLGGDLDI